MNITLPWPPSVNAMYRVFRNRSILSAAGRAYIAESGKHLLIQEAAGMGIDKRVAVSILVYPPDRRRRDLDNLLKGALDALVHAQVIRDDSLIDRLTLERCNVVTDGKLLVTVEPL